MVVVGKMVEGVTEVCGLGDDVVGAEIIESPKFSEAGGDERLTVVSVQREKAVVNKSLIPSGGNDDELVLDVAVELDEAAMTVSVEVAVGDKNFTLACQ